MTANPTLTPFGHAMRTHFAFPPSHRPFNNGSWGSVPTAVSAYRRDLLTQAEERTDNFQRRTAGPLLLQSRRVFANWLGARFEDTVIVPNATTGANVVLRNIEWKPGDVVLAFDFLYDAFANALAHIAETQPIRVETMNIPLTDQDVPHAAFVDLFERTVQKVRAAGQTPRMVIFDTFPSVPAIRLPYQALTAKARELGVLSLLDGAHGVGIEPLKLAELDADFFISNAHKWGFVPPVCAVMVVPERNQRLIRSALPTGYSFFAKGEEMAEPGKPGEESQFALAFRYVATMDLTPFLCAEAAWRFRQDVCGGEEAIRRYICDLAKHGGKLVAEKLGTRVLDNAGGELAKDCPMTLILLPIDIPAILENEWTPKQVKFWVEAQTMEESDTYFKIDVYDGRLWARLSAQIYLELEDFEWAAGVLQQLCERVNAGEYLTRSS